MAAAKPRQWAPTLEELARWAALLGHAEAYPRSARDGGRLRKVA
jgi:hypothetical protein